MDLLEQAPRNADPALRNVCAGAFGRHATLLRDPTLGYLREVLSHLHADMVLALSYFDVEFYQLLSVPDGEGRAFGVIEALLRREDGGEVFVRPNSTRHLLSNGDGIRRDKLVV